MEKTKVHFIGIGGVSQSKLALMLKNNGYIVSGSDREKSKVTDFLQKNGIKIFIGHKKENVIGADIVVYNGAICDDNAELVQAKKLSLKIIKRSEALAKVASKYKQNIVVCGCHGKTTTVGLISYAFLEKEPQMHLGGDLTGKNFEISASRDFFITEGCEFQKSFLALKPNVCVMLNIDADHLDCYKDIDDIESTFLQFSKQIKKSGCLIFNGDDARCKRIGESFYENKLSFGFGKKCDVRAKKIKFNNGKIRFNLIFKGKFVKKIEAKLFGKHNVYNLLATCALCLHFGLEKFDENLKKFDGIKRRMEFVGKLDNANVYHDYAHHPTEIKASIKASKLAFKKGVVVVFEPHTYSRTKSLWENFSVCFEGAKKVFLLPIYSAREKPIKDITSKNLAKGIKNCTYVEKIDDLKNELKKFKNKTILILGAGSIEKVAHKIVDKN